jgi:hypothetical protein
VSEIIFAYENNLRHRKISGARTAGEYGSVIARRQLADVAISLLSLFKP